MTNSFRSKDVALKEALKNYLDHPRALPWRKTHDPYRILVSEIMLQQTQVERVKVFYKRFLKRFPTVSALSRAPLSAVLKEWQGLGYNRRAKMLHESAKIIASSHKGRVPREYESLLELPGIGEYTAKAVRVFAHNEPEVLIETNVRAVYLHHFFKHAQKKVSDGSILPIIEATCDAYNPRRFYSAVMDYGSVLKRSVLNPSRKSAHHVKQKALKGSNREVRGALLKSLSKRNHNLESLTRLGFELPRVIEQLRALEREGFIEKRTKTWGLVN